MSEPMPEGTEEYPAYEQYQKLQEILDQTLHEMLRLRGVPENAILSDYLVIAANTFVDEEGDFDAEIRFVLGPGGFMPHYKMLGLLHGALEKTKQPIVVHESYMMGEDDDDDE